MRRKDLGIAWPADIYGGGLWLGAGSLTVCRHDVKITALGKPTPGSPNSSHPAYLVNEEIADIFGREKDMKKILVLLLLAVFASSVLAVIADAPPAKKSTLNAVDYGMVPGCTDAGICLNKLWDDANNKCSIALPAGVYNVCTPIVWTGKSFSCTAEQTILSWRGGDQTVLTVGADPKHGDHGNSMQSSYICGLQMGNEGKTGGTGLRIQNASKSVFDRMVFTNFRLGVLQWSDENQNGQDYYSYFNVVRDCNFYCCTTCIKTDGVKEFGSSGGVQSHDMRITGFDGSGAIETFFDFDVAGSNFVEASSCQTDFDNPFILKAGQGSNTVSVLYFESSGKGANPWKGRLRLNSDDNVIYFRHAAQYLNVEDTGHNNTIIDPTAKTAIVK